MIHPMTREELAEYGVSWQYDAEFKLTIEIDHLDAPDGEHQTR